MDECNLNNKTNLSSQKGKARQIDVITAIYEILSGFYWSVIA